MRPLGLDQVTRATRLGALSLATLAGVALTGATLTGCGGGGGGGSDAEFAAQALAVVDMDLDGRDSVALNTPLVIEFSEFVDGNSIRPDTVQIRKGPRYGIQSFGDFKVQGQFVTFYPRLPTKADLSDAGFQPKDPTKLFDGSYRVSIVGFPRVNHVLAYTGRPLTRTFVGSFATAAATDPDVFSTDHYKTALPQPAVRYTNPPDVIPESPWTVLGGAKEVPTDATITVALEKAPLLPSTVTSSNVSLTMIERFGAPVVPPRPIQGTPELLQDFDSVFIIFRPTFPLADQARYVLRMENRITDLTGAYDLADNEKRVDLRHLVDTSPGDTALQNFALAHPEEIDPRTFLIFTTRDELTKDKPYTLRFDGTDLDQNGGNGLDPKNTTASFNSAVSGAVAAVLTAAGGTGVMGDFSPAANTTLNTNTTDPLVTNGTFNFNQVTINQNVTVTVVGTLPVTIASLKDVSIAGTLQSTGGVGDNAEQSYASTTVPLANGGAGVLGGGAGGACYTGTSTGQRGLTGTSGANGGGGGGQGGYEPGGTTPGYGGGGGGGGHQYAGSQGGPGTYPSYASWNGTGGNGGSSGGIVPSSTASSDGKLWYQKGVGGGGGGAGGNSHYYSTYNWHNGAAGGGGGGGGILVKSAGNIVVTGYISTIGGKGGNVGNPGYYYYGAAGGGGGGGAIALYANNICDVRNSTLDTSGGAGGNPYTYGWGGSGGKGGGGYIQLEALVANSTKIPGYSSGSVSGATILPDFGVGAFNPTGSASDAPSYFTSAWFNMGVFDPILQSSTVADFVDQNYADCTITYELQMAREDPTNFGHADTSSISVSTGDSSDAVKASNWVTLNSSGGGIQDVTGTQDFTGMNGHHYQFYRVRISFTLKDGQTRADNVPYVDALTLHVKY